MGELKIIDLNADLGEGVGDDAPMLKIVSSANIAGGGHAGGGDILAETVFQAKNHKVRIGAHPSYLDKENFGRISQAKIVSHMMLQSQIIEQIITVHNAALYAGEFLSHVKPHGALYNDAFTNSKVANIIVMAVISSGRLLGWDSPIPIMGMPNSKLEEEATLLGVPFIREGFADRTYQQNGSLTSRNVPGSVIEDPDQVVQQALSLALNKEVRTHFGKKIPMPVESICVHGDTPNSIELAKAIYQAFSDHNIMVASIERT